MITTLTYLLQDINTNEVLLSIDGNNIETSLVFKEAKEYTYDEALETLNNNSVLLKDFHIVVKIENMNIFPVENDKEFLHRLAFEQNELISRLSNLQDLLNKEQPPFIDDAQWALLQVQSFIMRSYVNVLSQRKALL